MVGFDLLCVHIFNSWTVGDKQPPFLEVGENLCLHFGVCLRAPGSPPALHVLFVLTPDKELSRVNRSAWGHDFAGENLCGLRYLG